MCAPSWSASERMMTLLYLRLSIVKILADARAQRRDDGAELLVGQHLVDALFLDVEGLAAQRQNGLKAAVAALLGAAAGGIALDDEQLVLLRLSARCSWRACPPAARPPAGFSARATSRALRAASRTLAALHRLFDDAPCATS